MARLIKRFEDNSLLEYDTGRFDQWCIYHTVCNHSPYAIKDIEIFTNLTSLGTAVGTINLYMDFINVYEQTDQTVNSAILKFITELSTKYKEHSSQFDFLLTCLYAGMVAEENKNLAILKKKIKRLGVHQILVEDRAASFAANFSKNKPWQELLLECKARGF